EVEAAVPAPEAGWLEAAVALGVLQAVGRVEGLGADGPPVARREAIELRLHDAEDAAVRAEPEVASTVVQDGEQVVVEEAVGRAEVGPSPALEAEETVPARAHPDGAVGLGQDRRDERPREPALRQRHDTARVDPVDAAAHRADPEAAVGSR